MIGLVAGGEVSHKAAKETLLPHLWSICSKVVAGVGTLTFDAAGGLKTMIVDLGLKQMNDTGALEAIAAEVLAKNPKSVEEFRAGKDKAFNALVGQVMKATQGKANPGQASEILRKLLAG
jgi:aspartyl-tRNA(Asn)/glutamyl-tRNA(Gln) amidotransferase subunit B